jgi:hypothetical protein
MDQVPVTARRSTDLKSVENGSSILLPWMRGFDRDHMFVYADFVIHLVSSPARSSFIPSEKRSDSNCMKKWTIQPLADYCYE